MLGGREIDFGVVDKRLNGACKICAVDEVPWAPHFMLHVTVHNELVQAEYRPVVVKAGPTLPWAAYAAAEATLEWLPSAEQITGTSAKLSEQFATWARQAENYLLATEIESVPRGRGCFLAVEFQPRVNAQVRTQVWKCPSVGFWTVMQRWCDFLFGVIDRGRWSKQASDLFVQVVAKAPLVSAHWCEHDGGFSLLGLQFVARSMWQITSFVRAKVLVQLSAIVGVAQKRALRMKRKDFGNGPVMRS